MNLHLKSLKQQIFFAECLAASESHHEPQAAEPIEPWVLRVDNTQES